MYETSSKLNEIILLNRQLRNFLSMKGGGRQDLLDFKKKLNDHINYIIIVFITSCVVLIYFCSSIPTKKMLIGGGLIDNISKRESSFLDQFYELIDYISEYMSGIHEDLLEKTKESGGPVIDKLNNITNSLGSITFDLLWITPIPPFFPPFIPFIIIILLIFYACSNYILDRKLYLPCWGCSKGSIFFKCMPGTGKGSISCTIYTELLNKIKMIIRQFKYIGDLLNTFTNSVKTAINSVLYLVKHISDWVSDAFGQSIGKIFDALNFLKHINIPDNWGFNLGEFLICPDFSTKGNACIYNANGSLRIEHGNNPLFKIFWKMIRIILEVPPNVPKFPFGGGEKLKLEEFKQPKINQPKGEKHNVDTKIKPSSKKPITSDKKNIIYENLLKVLIKIDLNPIKWLATLFNLVVDAINLVIKQILKLFQLVLVFIFSLIVKCAKILTDALGKLFNQVLRPLDEVAKIAAQLPKQIYKCIKAIFDIGFFTLIIHYFYIILLSMFPFLKFFQSFIIVLTLIIFILSILIICPMIGAYCAFFKPYNYARGIFEQIYTQFIYIIKNYDKGIQISIEFLQDQGITKEIHNYINNMNTSYKYVSGVIIIVIIIVIILNIFTNINRKFLIFVKDLLYDRYANKFKGIINKYKYYKMKQIEKDQEDEQQSNTSINTNENNLFLNKINIIKNLNINNLDLNNLKKFI